MSSKIKKINIRAIFLYLIMCGLAIIIVMKILFIQTLQPQISKINTPSFIPLSAPRGNIFSDNGSLLAISMPLYNIYLDLSVIEENIFIKESSLLASGLSNLFEDKSTNEYLKFLKSNRNSKYLRLKHKVTQNELNLLKSLPILKLGKKQRDKVKFNWKLYDGSGKLMDDNDYTFSSGKAMTKLNDKKL